MGQKLLHTVTKEARNAHRIWERRIGRKLMYFKAGERWSLRANRNMMDLLQGEGTANFSNFLPLRSNFNIKKTKNQNNAKITATVIMKERRKRGRSRKI